MNIKNWTGERLETFVNSGAAAEHLHRYALALELIKNKKVLDIASGEGYGSNLMAAQASEVIGVDICKKTIDNAKSKYHKGNLTFIEGSASKIPLDNDLFDVVVSFETIEHHDKHDEMMAEIKRVMKPNGILIISSPDKLNYSDKPNFYNKFHIKELYREEFKDIIYKNFVNAKFFNQRATFMSLLIPDANDVGDFREGHGDYSGVNWSESFEPMYIISIASDGDLPKIGLSAFTDDRLIGNLLSAKAAEVRNTLSFKIGHNLLLPFKLVKRLLF